MDAIRDLQNGFAEFSMSIVKTSNRDGVIKWRSVNSDTDKDEYKENMSVELFRDMVRRIEDDEPFPEAFKSAVCEDGWCGGMPYISLAHYKSGGSNRVNVPGEVKSVYVDGTKLKSTGTLYNNPLGLAVYRSLLKDIEERRVDKKVRISIGFLDLEHTHGDKFTFTRRSVSDKCHLCAEGVGDKIYKKGVLVHLALTRVPANPRTDMEVEKSVMTTKKEDLESIVDDPEVLKGLELKSQAEDDLIVVKSDDKDAGDAEKDEKEDKEGKGKQKKKEVVKEESVAETPAVEVTAVDPEPAIVPEVVPSAEPTMLQKSLAKFANDVEQVKSKGLYGDAALQELQGSFDALANVVRSEVNPPSGSKQAADGLSVETLRSLLAEMLPQAIAQSVAPMQAELSELRALSLAGKPAQPKENFIPEPRSLNLNLVQKNAVEQLTQKSTSQFARLANVSVGLPENTVR